MDNRQLPRQLHWATKFCDKVAQLCCVSDIGLRMQDCTKTDHMYVIEPPVILYFVLTWCRCCVFTVFLVSSRTNQESVLTDGQKSQFPDNDNFVIQPEYLATLTGWENEARQWRNCWNICPYRQTPDLFLLKTGQADKSPKQVEQTYQHLIERLHRQPCQPTCQQHTTVIKIIN